MVAVSHERASTFALLEGCTAYGSFEQLRREPTMIAYHLERTNLAETTSIIRDWIGVSALPYYWLVDVGSREPKAAVLDVISNRQIDWGVVYAYHVCDPSTYFEHVSSCGTTIYFLPPNSAIDLERCFLEYEQETLTQFLQETGMPFATLGDCHQDDAIVVSLRSRHVELPG